MVAGHQGSAGFGVSSSLIDDGKQRGAATVRQELWPRRWVMSGGAIRVRCRITTTTSQSSGVPNGQQQTVVLYPFPGVGHVVPMLQLAKVFLGHGYDVTMVLVEPPARLPGFSAVAIDRVRASTTSISFHVLPVVPYDITENSGNKPPLFVLLQRMYLYNDPLEAFLRTIPRMRLHSLVTSIFSFHGVDVAARLRVPVYTFFASAAAFLAVMAQIRALLAGRQTGLKELGEAPLEFRGVPPLPASHLIDSMLRHPEDELCRTMVNVFKRCTVDTDGVLVNTFESLENPAVQALRDPGCVPGRVLPPIYCVGPLVSDGTGAAEEQEAGASRHECLESLNGADDDFLERTKDRGFVIESWAPQVNVLQHPATGAFISHCGWNLTSEAITFTSRVPMLCWPLYAEQKLNKVLIAEAMGVGLEMEGYMTGFIKAEEVEAKVRLVIESREGRELREQVVARKNEAEVAFEDGGSSQAAFVQFLADVNNLWEHQKLDIYNY
ncbi:hypothetical protein PR202_gb16914 [Eleusine coracana subsp. coracana]|uniref:Glycosyltransferase n=1 Tax=Eleusine coracana subsp. coracana TaxID=191504 RepID=A0AAV5F1L4_ELECO|nr:hypothetical protein PR202_gb16914 [Eleusine coracana subsp. coracana]